MQTECGHLFCKGCLEPVLEGPNSVCPVDKTSISRYDVRMCTCTFMLLYILSCEWYQHID